MDIPAVVATFLRRYARPGQPLLLALSGGPDSLALFYSLLVCRQRKVIGDFGVAHVDHGWRVTSGEEAEWLARCVQEAGVAWHKRVLDPSRLQGNLEEACRRERLSFFEELCQQHGYQAVMLGHQADDQAETVLKRLFEGASLTALGAMAPQTSYRGLRLWRPCLSIPKRALVAWLLERGYSFVDDSTNYDPRYLRAKMRSQLMPELSALFGKEVSPALAAVGAEARELEEYLSTLCAPFVAGQQRGPFGVWLGDVPSSWPPLAVRYLLRHLLQENGCGVFSRPQLETASQHLLAGLANKSYRQGGVSLYIDRGRAFVVPQPLPVATMTMPLGEGDCFYAPWHISVRPITDTSPPPRLGWDEAWRGSFSLALPAAAGYRLGPADPKAVDAVSRRSLDSLWNSTQVPAFLRSWLPVIWRGDNVAAQLLTPRNYPVPSTTTCWYLHAQLFKD